MSKRTPALSIAIAACRAILRERAYDVRERGEAGIYPANDDEPRSVRLALRALDRAADERLTPVLFRVGDEEPDVGGDSVFAILPSDPGDGSPGSCGYYVHVGGHSHASYAGMIATSRPATRAEARKCRRSMESYPYYYRLRTVRSGLPFLANR